MCLGIPMRVVTSDSGGAVVRRQDGEERLVSLMLVGGPQPVGTPLLVHLDTAIRVLAEDEVPLLEDALKALDAAAKGEAFEHLVKDLVDRTPELPPHLREGGP
ncbi:MAG: HypC/HybG/HupF family hydrogenase formation chaperone [Myxococcota bacterium]